MRRFGLGLFVALFLTSAPVLAQHEDAHAAAGHDAHATAHEDAHGGHGHEAFSWTKELIGSFINFAILFGLLVYFGGPKIRAFLVDRRAEIATSLEEAQRLKAEAEAKHAEYAGKLAKLDAEIAKIREDMVKAGEAERDRIVAEAEKKAERLRNDTKFILAQRSKELRDELVRESVEAAVAAAEKLLREKTTADDQQRLSRAYLERLVVSAKESQS
jgi:F-type H+-transporting ATPase subunit b